MPREGSQSEAQRRPGGLRTRLSIAWLTAALASLALAGGAAAETPFGSDPNEGINTPFSCSSGAPTGFGIPFFGTEGSQSCMWTWNNLAVGSDIVPFPVSGGTGTVTSVTLPAMPNPGPMAVVVLSAALNETTNPATPNSICCQVKQVGPTFTVPANQVTTVPQSLRVSSTEAADPNQPGDTAFYDLMGVAILSPSASLPVRYTGNTSLSNFDGSYAYYPAPSAPNGEYSTPYDPAGFRLLARFTLALDGEGGGGGGGEAAGGGVKLTKKPVRVGKDGKTVTLGRVANPPTAGTTQTLTAPAGARAAALSRKAKKPALYGRARTTVAAGKTRPLKLKLNGRGRSLLARKHKLKATLTVIAGNAQGETQTLTRRVTIKPRKKPKKR